MAPRTKEQKAAEDNLLVEIEARDYLLRQVQEATMLPEPLKDEVLQHLTVALASAQADVAEARKRWTFST